MFIVFKEPTNVFHGDVRSGISINQMTNTIHLLIENNKENDLRGVLLSLQSKLKKYREALQSDISFLIEEDIQYLPKIARLEQVNRYLKYVEAFIEDLSWGLDINSFDLPKIDEWTMNIENIGYLNLMAFGTDDNISYEQLLKLKNDFSTLLFSTTNGRVDDGIELDEAELVKRNLIDLFLEQMDLTFSNLDVLEHSLLLIPESERHDVIRRRLNKKNEVTLWSIAVDLAEKNNDAPLLKMIHLISPEQRFNMMQHGFPSNRSVPAFAIMFRSLSPSGRKEILYDNSDQPFILRLIRGRQNEAFKVIAHDLTQDEFAALLQWTGHRDQRSPLYHIVFAQINESMLGTVISTFATNLEKLWELLNTNILTNRVMHCVYQRTVLECAADFPNTLKIMLTNLPETLRLRAITSLDLYRDLSLECRAILNQTRFEIESSQQAACQEVLQTANPHSFFGHQNVAVRMDLDDKPDDLLLPPSTP